MSESENLAAARRYLLALERNESVVSFFTPDVVMEEYPNRIVPNGAVRDLEALREANARGRQVIAEQRYEIRNVVESGDQVALEVLWTATLAVPVSTLPAGAQMRAHFAMFLEFRDGRIRRQRNYDCYDSW